MSTAEGNGVPCVNLLGIDVCKMTMAQVLMLCASRIEARDRLLLGVVNVAKLVNARKDVELRRSIQEADIVVADGQGVVWLSRWIGNPVPERVAGIDIMIKLLELANGRAFRVYFLGATEAVVEGVVGHVRAHYPKVQIAGYRDGYFDLASEGQVVAEEIQSSKADILFVAMPSPLKENFLRCWMAVMDIPVCHGVGGSFDVVAGLVKRAPRWMQRSGLEWLYRLFQEPQRMWKRYLVTNLQFLVCAGRQVLRCRLRGRASH